MEVVSSWLILRASIGGIQTNLREVVKAPVDVAFWLNIYN